MSINAHFVDLLLFLENDARCNDINIIVLTETWHNVLSCDYIIEGYSLYFCSIKINQNDGVILLSVEFFIIILWILIL